MVRKVDDDSNSPDKECQQPYAPLQPAPARQNRNSPGQVDNEKNSPDWQDERCPGERFTRYRMYSVCRFFRYDPSVFSAQQLDHATQNVCKEEWSVYCSWSFGPRHHTPHQSGFMQMGIPTKLNACSGGKPNGIPG
jgi:hypothetical protein